MTYANGNDTRAEPEALCPEPSRFWAVEMGVDSWGHGERRHVSAWPHCRRSEDQVRAAVGGSYGHDAPTEAATVETASADATRPPGPATEEFTPDPARMRPPSRSTPIPGRLGPYELIQQVGQGGMGAVYKAIDTRLDRTVAVKIGFGLGYGSDHHLDRFLCEGRTIARLSHPSILPILDVGEHDGLVYTVAPFLEGPPLASLLHRDGPIAPGEAARIVAEIAEALDHAHARGVLHRDVKPSNILLDADGRPHLVDFGLAKVAEEDQASLTCAGSVLGTPSYMSPEQVLGTQLDRRTDIYSLGATLYTLLTGRPPFRGPTVVETIRKLLEEEPPSPRSLNPAIDRDLETICLKAIQRDPSRRYATAGEMAEDLRRYLNREPILARRLGVPERALDWARRHPAAVALIGAAICLGAIAFGLAAPGGRPGSREGVSHPSRIIERGDGGTSPTARPQIIWPASPQPPITPADLAGALNDLGRLYRDLERPAQAEAAYRRSAAILRQMSRAHPEIPAYRRGLADASRNLAELLRASGRVDEADVADQEARILPASLDDARSGSPAAPGAIDPFTTTVIRQPD